jgi:hypothetical protein
MFRRHADRAALAEKLELGASTKISVFEPHSKRASRISFCSPSGWIYNRDVTYLTAPNRGFIVMAPLSGAPEAYEKFDHRGVGEGKAYTKVVIKPELDRKAA